MFRMANCLLLMTKGDLDNIIRSSQTQSWDEKFDFSEFFRTEQDVIVCFVRINKFHANIDVNDNKQLFWF